MLKKDPNKCEKIILDLLNNKGEFTGNGSLWITFKDGKRKNLRSHSGYHRSAAY